MENNQQHKSERNTSINTENNSFDNQQPGQQLPAKNEAATNTDFNEAQSKEHHSESSKPNADDETLGTP